MSNVVEFSRKARAKAKPAKKHEPMTMDTIRAWAKEDIEKLMLATSQTEEQAIKMASDFYRAYPALVELVREQVMEGTR